MSLNPELTKQLNLLERSPTFVLRENKQSGRIEVRTMKQVPDQDGIYWLAGSTVLRNGIPVPSVLRVDTDAGGSLQGVYWKVGTEWYEHSDPVALARLGTSREAAFPFDWSYSVPLERDIYHG